VLRSASPRLGERVYLALREPSLGSIFGVKGGATGGGKAVLVPGGQDFGSSRNSGRSSKKKTPLNGPGSPQPGEEG
jgi:hypothetical protein